MAAKSTTQPDKNPPTGEEAESYAQRGAQPLEGPPEGASAVAVTGEEAAPQEYSAEEATMAAAAGAGDAQPSAVPPEQTFGDGGYAAWQNNKRIDGLWCNNANRNSWVHVVGVGWRKLANNSDSAVVALTILGAHAREKNAPVNYSEETGNQIAQIYVW